VIGWASFPNSTRTHSGVQNTWYSLLHPLPASTADGVTNRASTGRHKQLQHQPLGAQGLAAHHDFNGARSSSGEARNRSGRGEAPTAALRPDLERSDSIEGYDGLELALRGAKGGWVCGGAAGGSPVPWKGARRTNLVATARSSASGAREGNERVVRWSGFYCEWRRRRASTSAGDIGRQAATCPHARTRRCARGGHAGQGRRDPYRVTVAIHILPLSVFLRNSTKI